MMVSAALSCLCVAAAQSIPSDEIRSRTVPYVPPPLVTLRTEVRVVEVPVVVRDGQFHAVAGLTRDDFEVYDDGKKQAITSFSVQSFHPRADTAAPVADAAARPRFLALCFDDLHLPPAALKPVKDAAERFVKTSLAPGDRVVVVRTSRSEDAKFTGDVPALVEQIAKVTSAPPAVFDGSGLCPRLSFYEAYQIANRVDPGDQLLHAKVAECSACSHHACPEGLVTGPAREIWEHTRSATVSSLGVIQSLVDGMAKLPGQRIILLTSGGFLSGTLEPDMERLTDQARRAEVVISGVDTRGVHLNPSIGLAYDSAAILASGTGGTFFHNNNDLELGFRELGMLPETSYVLGFAPAGTADGRFHKLKVQLSAGKKYSVEARLGYTALAANADATNSAVSKLDREVMASDTIGDLPASFTWEQWEKPPGVAMIVHLDIGRLHFQPWQDRRTQKLTIVAVLLDSHGSFVAGKRSELQLSFKDATFAQLAKTGFTTALTIKAPSGSYTVRAVVQDAMEGKLAAASGAVEIR
jgi:VWFA-related protein